MIDRVIEFSAKNKFIVIVLTLVAALAGWWSMIHVPLDAIPDLSDTQVIVYSRWDRSPDIVEDQVTYPIVMTVATTFLGLVPIMWATGTGSDVMKRITAPMIGGIFSSFLLELLIYPVIYEIWKWNFEVKRQPLAVLATQGQS